MPIAAARASVVFDTPGGQGAVSATTGLPIVVIAVVVLVIIAVVFFIRRRR